jgi:hypothetical protein
MRQSRIRRQRWCLGGYLQRNRDDQRYPTGEKRADSHSTQLRSNSIRPRSRYRQIGINSF